MIKDLVFVTGNKGKAEEAQAILGFPIEVVSLELDEIQSLDLQEIVTHKVNQAYKEVKKPVFVDDVGLEVVEWNGFPGPFIKFLLKAGGNDLLLKMVATLENKTVIAKACIGYHDGTNVHTFVGEVNGQIVKPQGEGGWGWDPIFLPEHSKLTYGMMDPEEKNKISHRRTALEKFKEFLQTL